MERNLLCWSYPSDLFMLSSLMPRSHLMLLGQVPLVNHPLIGLSIYWKSFFPLTRSLSSNIYTMVMPFQMCSLRKKGMRQHYFCLLFSMSNITLLVKMSTFLTFKVRFYLSILSVCRSSTENLNDRMRGFTDRPSGHDKAVSMNFKI